MKKLKINFNIHELRKKNSNMSGEDLASMLTESSGKTYKRSTINNWESGYRIKDEDIINICQCFHISADDLLFTDLGKKPAKFRSDDDAAVDAAKYTGLSHKAISVLHYLHNAGSDKLSVLSTILEEGTFLASVLPDIKTALNYMQASHEDSTTLSNEEQKARQLLTEKGFLITSPQEAGVAAARQAGMRLFYTLLNFTPHDETKELEEE